MKAFTDISQSKKLAKILPLESADMSYSFNFDSEIYEISTTSYKSWVVPKYAQPDDGFGQVIPAWSLAALLDLLPNNEHITTTLSRGSWKIDTVEYVPNTWWCEYEDTENQTEFNVSADNPIDACYEMILKLYKLKLF